MINKKNTFLTGSWLSGLLLSAEIFISTGEWGGPDANTDRGKQLISAVRASGSFPGNQVEAATEILIRHNVWGCGLKFWTAT